MNFSNISLVQNKILCVLVFCNSAYFLWTFTFSIFCVHILRFSAYKYTLCFFCFAFFFRTSLISSCNFFTSLLVLFFNFFILLKIFQPHQNPSLKFDPLICVHRHAVSPVHFLHHVLCSFVFFLFFCFSFRYAYLMTNCCFSTLVKK